MGKRKDYPWNQHHLRLGGNLIAAFMVFCLVMGYYLVVGVIIPLITFIIVKYINQNTSSQTKKIITHSYETDNTRSKKWLIVADERVCIKAFEGNGELYINCPDGTLNKWDCVYLYIESAEKIGFKSKVLEKQGSKYKVKLLDEYRGWALSKSCLVLKGFKGADSIKYPTSEPITLLEYIEEQFLSQIYTDN